MCWIWNDSILLIKVLMVVMPPVYYYGCSLQLFGVCVCVCGVSHRFFAARWWILWYVSEPQVSLHVSTHNTVWKNSQGNQTCRTWFFFFRKRSQTRTTFVPLSTAAAVITFFFPALVTLSSSSFPSSPSSFRVRELKLVAKELCGPMVNWNQRWKIILMGFLVNLETVS